MKISFDSIFFIVFGIISIFAGILNKNILFWMSIGYDGLKDLLSKNYNRVTNIGWGIISLIIGLALLHSNK